MTQRVVHRPARQQRPQLDLSPVDVVPPQPVPERAGGVTGVMQVLLPLAGGGGMMAMMIGNRNPIMLVAGSLMLAATVCGGIVAFVGQRTGSARRLANQRRRYLDYLDGVRDELREAGAEQRAIACHRHPAPAALSDILQDPHRLWERRLSDPDFLVLRVGSGRDQLWRRVTLASSVNPMVETDPITQAAAQLVVDRDRALDAMPVAVPVDGVVSVVGEPAQIRNVAAAMTAQLLALHAPDDVRLAWCVGRSALTEFDWIKWLPHCLDSDVFDGPAPRRLVANDAASLRELLGGELSRRLSEAAQSRRIGGRRDRIRGPRLVVVVDQVSAGSVDLLAHTSGDLTLSELGVAMVALVPHRVQEPSHVDVRVVCEEGQVTVEDLRPVYHSADSERIHAERRQVQGASAGVADQVSIAQIGALARQVSPLRLVADNTNDAPLETTLDLRGLLGIDDEATFDISQRWAPRPSTDFLKVPIGVGPDGMPVFLDLKEFALGGMGPHGLCVGATGSGKSEVLRTLVLTLAMTHPPERLSLVLVDYKGGATFAGLEDLPHTSAMISNLSDDAGLVDRLHDALYGEMKRRQQILLEAGNLPNTTEYNRRRDAGEPLAPLPNLLVVIDEFSELLTAKPDFIELFIAIGRIGRSIGIHQLLASQRLEEGKLRGLESFLSYRLGLRTFNEQESRIVLGVSDAFALPPIPGSGYLKVVTTVFERFKAAYVSGPYRPAGDEAVDAPPMPAWFPLYNDTQRWLEQIHGNGATPAQADNDTDVRTPSTLDVVVSRLRQKGEQVHRIWLPPLPKTLPLDSIVGELTTDPAYGLTTADPSRRGTLRVPVGLLDRPEDQIQETYVLDLSGAGGHVCVMGAPQTGKSTLLRTLVAATAVTHTPTDIAFYCVDFSGGALTPLAALPHVAGVATRLDPDRVRRTIAEVTTLLDERERSFAAHGIDSIDTMRDLHRAGRLPDIPSADIALVIDNYPVLKNDFEDLAQVVQEIGTRGLGYGVHLILSTGRWADLRMQLQAVIGTKLELRLNDPLDSTIGRKVAENLRADTPGRCLSNDGLTAHIALPRIDGDHDVRSAATGLDKLISRVVAAWTGPPVPPIRMLPALVTYDEVNANIHTDEHRVRLGVDETELRPVLLDLFGTDQHLLVFGDAGSGKTSVLRLLVQDLTSRYTDDKVIFLVLDVRRTLLDVVPEAHLGQYVGTAQGAASYANKVAGVIRDRQPPEDVTVTQLRERSWWTGPEIVVLCDDYDLLAPSAGPGPLAPFLDLLPQSRDLGFHLVLARRSGGAGRAIHEPIPQRLKELGAAALLLSGDRGEGQLWPHTYLSNQPPGRGTLIRKNRRPGLVQTIYINPSN